jgi:hypothetical protein
VWIEIDEDGDEQRRDQLPACDTHTAAELLARRVRAPYQ